MGYPKSSRRGIGKTWDSKAVIPLIDFLKYKSDNTCRTIAKEALGKIGHSAIKSLIIALKYDDWEFTCSVANLLKQMGWEPSNQTERFAYIIAARRWEELIKIGKPAMPCLIEALQNRDWYVRANVVETLGKMKDNRVLDLLISTLNDENLKVKLAAAKALGEIGDIRALEPLMAAFTIDNYDFQLFISRGLEKIGKPAVMPLISALKDKNSSTRRLASKSLGRIGDEQAIDPLVTVLMSDNHPGARSNAATALGELGNVKALEPLLLALKNDNSEISSSAAYALGLIGDYSE